MKGHVYERDNHLPLAIMWKEGIKNPGRKVNDFISFIDFAPTFFDLAGVKPEVASMQPIQGKSLLNILTSAKTGTTDPARDHVLLGRERQDVGRPHDQGYPVRAIVKGNLFYAVNYEPERWPSGNPETGYLDTDGGPTKTQLLEANRKGEYHNLWQLSFGKRPGEELYQIDKDPYCLKNIADDPAMTKTKATLRRQMEQELKNQNDPRMFGNGAVFDNYPHGEPGMRNFYERFIKGEKLKTNWVSPTDFEKGEFNQKCVRK